MKRWLFDEDRIRQFPTINFLNRLDVQYSFWMLEIQWVSKNARVFNKKYVQLSYIPYQYFIQLYIQFWVHSNLFFLVVRSAYLTQSSKFPDKYLSYVSSLHDLKNIKLYNFNEMNSRLDRKNNNYTCSPSSNRRNILRESCWISYFVYYIFFFQIHQCSNRMQ